MERYGNIRFTRRVVAFVCLLFVALSVLMPADFVKADTYTFGICNTYNENGIRVPETDGWYSSPGSFDCSGSPLYRWDDVTFASDKYHHRYGIFSIIFQGDVSVDSSNFTKLVKKVGSVNYTLLYWSQSSWSYSDYINRVMQYFVTDADYNIINPNSFQSTANYTGSETEFMSSILDRYISGDIGANVNSPTKVTNESIGYLQDVKLNLSYVTPIKGDSIFETTNYQIYTDMIYNLKWNRKKTTTDFDLSDSYIQLYGKAEYRKSEFDDVVSSDFFALSDTKASLGKLKFSFMELFEKSDKCKSAYLSDFPLSAAAYKDGKLQACSVTPNIKYKFYIRVYKRTDKGPWLCVSEKGSHHSNEFVNSGVKVPFNVSSGDLDSDGTYKPDGNINENGNGITGTGTDKDDADADTNANDKIQDKNNSDNSVWDNLENLVSGIASVPIIIKDIFSFLPSWCLNVTATGFALMITVCVIKFIRGK